VPPIANALLWSLIGFVSGSVPWSLVLARVFVGVDIRKTGDANPGGANAWRFGNWQVGLAGIILDGFKGAIPVGVAHSWFGVDGWGLVPVMVAPVVGHAWSPILGFKGGKALATLFGVWFGILFPNGAVALGVFFVLFVLLLEGDSWPVLFGQLGFLGYLVWLNPGAPLLVTWFLLFAIVTWKHRAGYREPVRLSRRVLRLAGRTA
jgi:glycerol-3-phosphate acyltransferase PlsY